MIKNYLKIAWRNLWRNKAFSLINIFGLSIGLAFTLLVAGYVWSEFQVNRQLRNHERQYIIQSKWKDPNMGIELTSVGALPKALREEYPSLVANYYRLDGISSNVSAGDKVFRENLQIGDSTMISMYGFHMLHGNSRSVFNEPFSLVINPAVAIKYFGRTNVVGEYLQIENFSGLKRSFKITGVLDPPARNTVTFLNDNLGNSIYIPASAADFFGRRLDTWNNFYIVDFVELQPGTSPNQLQKPIMQLLKKNLPDSVSRNLKVDIVPLSDFYLSPSIKEMLYTLAGVAFFILLMAIVNFVNISVSRANSRLVEIGVRKVLGAERKQLIVQFLSESLASSFIAAIVSLILYQACKPWVTGFLGNSLVNISAYPVFFLVFIVILAFLTGVLSGAYPALLLSSFKVINSVQGMVKSASMKSLFRKSLLCMQFGIALIVLVSSIVISGQIRYCMANTGYDKELVVSAQVPRNWTKEGVQHMEMVRQEFASLPQVEAACLSYQMPNGNFVGKTTIHTLDSSREVAGPLLIADEHYAKTYGLSIVAGSFLSLQSADVNPAEVVINETQAKALGFRNAEESIGKLLKSDMVSMPLKIRGVVEDFHFGSMQYVDEPIAFVHVRTTSAYRFLSFKLRAGAYKSGIAALQRKWSRLLPGSAFEYIFMDDVLSNLYATEIRLKNASYVATILSLIIVLLGVLGLVSLSVENRRKEISIRKVIGAPVSGVILLFVKEFGVILLISAVLSIPLAYILMRHWLNNYTYRISLGPQPFVISVFALGGVAMVLILLQTFKTASSNALKNLKS